MFIFYFRLVCIVCFDTFNFRKEQNKYCYLPESIFYRLRTFHDEGLFPCALSKWKFSLILGSRRSSRQSGRSVAKKKQALDKIK